ncbi:hypothetical protein GGX14DRAFT_388796 [Mycena pura]|uniref:Uncharacterized protein n=1 Tax=Mycena pura TaxID=153505 RepID=A0AAD6VTT1_9AGAR|nr:hypothetical protein GGX14DRAFT_388796 [Mycena pura]
MTTPTYQPAPNETLGEFVDLLFKRLFFIENDMALVTLTFENDVAADAEIAINGSSMPASAFLDILKDFHATAVAKLTKTEDLVVVPSDAGARSGVVAQHLTFTSTSKTDGKVAEHVSVLIVKVQEKEGKRVMTSLVEAFSGAVGAAGAPNVGS